MTITPEEIARLRALEAKATPGPWWREWNNADDHDDGIDVLACGHGGRVALVEDSEIRGTREAGHGPAAIADIIVAARNALPRLLDEIERLRAENDRLRVLTTCVCGMSKKDDLRADLREALALLRDSVSRTSDPPRSVEWHAERHARRDALMAKHKETT